MPNINKDQVLPKSKDAKDDGKKELKHSIPISVKPNDSLKDDTLGMDFNEIMDFLITYINHLDIQTSIENLLKVRVITK